MNAVLENHLTRELTDVTRRISGEYKEMPGLRLTPAQARRLWNLDRDRCDAALDLLVNAGVLRRTGDGSYVLD